MGTPRPKKKKKNKNWIDNHAAIRDTFLKLYQEGFKKGKIFPPTNKEIAETTGLSIDTITDHLEQLNVQQYLSSNALKTMVEPLLGTMAMLGTQGNVKAGQLFLEYFCGKLSTNIDITSKGEKLEPTKVSTGDTFEILVPAWQEQIEDINKKLETGRAGRE